ncbi:hypothetical protein EW145_g1661 [Phellinidium pouzarii]|uniref:Uncharacterized protein n=1 Tax=Phellinidium pouzarii TaxID=167371 RepID=A0A4S4LJ91_9AGAM|nr:hypothetical protein EW145_g1661 [Phellinidium pouzarii]
MIRPKIRALLIDLSGTLHIGSSATPFAIDALKRIRETGIDIRFCSNTSKESAKDLRLRLRNIGFDVHDGELWTSLCALKDVVKARNLQRPYFLLSKSAGEEFSEADKETGHHHSHYDSVVVGFAPELFNYDNLTKAFRILSENGPHTPEDSRYNSAIAVQRVPSPLITTHRARYIRNSDGELSLGPGPFVTALEDAVGNGIRAETVGKPNRIFYERVLASLRRDNLQLLLASQKESGDGETREWSDVAVIGDDIEADLGEGAVELVKTGKYRPGDESRPGLHPPDEVQDSFATFIDEVLKDRGYA